MSIGLIVFVGTGVGVSVGTAVFVGATSAMASAVCAIAVCMSPSDGAPGEQATNNASKVTQASNFFTGGTLLAREINTISKNDKRCPGHMSGVKCHELVSIRCDSR